jgi:uncharacterized SAM-binding protein YcdF (DUF218 family)
MLYTIVKSLLLPPGILIILFLLGFLWARRVIGRLFIFLGLVLLTLMSLPLVAEKLMQDLQPYPALSEEALSQTQARAILVLGAGRYLGAAEYGGDTLSVNSLERVRYAARLHKQTGLPVFVTGGSPPYETPPLAQLMRDVLEEEFRVPVAGVEDRSRTTLENARLSREMLLGQGIDRILLVTHAWHMPRAMQVFAETGLAVTPAPTAFFYRTGQDKVPLLAWLPSADAFLTSYRAIHEYLGQAWYQLKAAG